jgi:methylenetetrahydrofolate reductase (NADPH)
MSLMSRRRAAPRTEANTPAPAARRLVASMRYELVPMKSVDQAIADLPAAAPVSVTCSPVKGIAATLELTARLLDAGHDAVPHLAARLVEGPAEVAAIARWLRDHRLDELFVIAGDAEVPHGPYDGAVGLLRELVSHDTGLSRIGVSAYPDGHSSIDSAALHDALHAKQALLADAGISASATTQMCFDPRRIREWIRGERAAGLTLPLHLGVPGVVDRAKLMTMGVRLGIGASLRYLSKNRGSMIKMLAPGGYDPTDLVASIADDADELGVVGVHAFTFNSVADTKAWQHAIIAA